MATKALLINDLPDWRWSAVRAFVDDDRIPSRRPEDEEFRKAFFYLRRYNVASMSDVFQLKRDYPQLFAAHQMYMNTDGVRWIVEAGLMTKATIPELAEYVGSTPAVLSTYAHWYFDVKERLGARGYILSCVIKPAIVASVHNWDFDFLYKTLAYCAGWDVFKDFVDHKNSTPDAMKFYRSNFQDNIIKLAWAATKRVQVNNYNALEVIDRGIALMTLEKEKGGAGANEAQLVLIEDLLKNCKLAIMQPGAALEASEVRAITTTEGSTLQYGDKIPLVKEAPDGKVE